jgi:hypothetical protein
MFDRSDLEIYDRITSPKSLKIPQRSRLYFLEPIGVETPFTESLSSYLTRLATEHCLPLKKLIMGEIAPAIMGEKYHSEMLSKNASTLFGNSDAKPAINGMRDMTKSLVNALEQLTLRQDLQYLSYLTYQGIIKERGLFRQHKAWCHKCFEEWQQENKPIYESLLWSFKDVYYCLKHNCQLCDRCIHCDSQQKAITNNSRLGYCDHCQQWLGKRNITVGLLPEDFQDNHFIVQSIGDLIAFTPQLQHQPNLKSLKKKLQLILFCFERAIHQDLGQYVVLIKLIEKLKIDLKQNYSQPINLTEIIIPVCQQAKISISQLFEKDYDNLAWMLAQNIETDYKIS